jgi:hypothetical protein
MTDINFLSKEGLDRYDNKMKNYIGIELTKAEYDQLSEEEKNKGTYWITDYSSSGGNSNIELDKTLSIEGKAADAQAVGKALGIEMTQAEYDALSEEEKNNGTYWVTDGQGGSEGSIELDPTLSIEGMAADAKAVGDTKISYTDVVDNLTSTSTNLPLSANQGKVLQDTKLNKTDVVNNLTSTSTTAALSAYQGKVLDTNVKKCLQIVSFSGGTLTTKSF